MALKPVKISPHNVRRLKYGLNVTVAVLAAMAIAMLVNWLAYHGYWRGDFTATRKYSLSQQTQLVLRQLDDDFRIISAFRVWDTHTQRVRDLLSEYSRYSPNINIEHLDELNLIRQERIFADLLAQYDDELTPLRDAMEQAMRRLERTNNVLTRINELLRAEFEDPALEQNQAQGLLGDAMHYFTTAQQTITQNLQDAQNRLDTPLPNYARVHQSLQTICSTLAQQIIPPAVTRFDQVTHEEGIPDSTKNVLLQASSQLKPLQQELNEASNALRRAELPQGYERVRATIEDANSILILGKNQARALNVNDMVRVMPDQAAADQIDPEHSFLGEEQLTGALVSMTMDNPPMVVFVSDTPGRAMGQRGQYTNVAQRLRNLNFDVREWSPAARQTQFGQPMPAGPAPEPAPGQQAVWIVLPMPPADPTNPMAGQNKQIIARKVSEWLDRGDHVMLNVMFDSTARFGPSNPMQDVLDDWGVTVQTDRIVVNETQVTETRVQTTPGFQISRWPDATAITRAVEGLQGIFAYVSPIIIDTSPQTDIQYHTLVELSRPRMWTTRDFTQDISSIRYDEETSAERYLIGVAAQRHDNRLIVFSDPMWCSDEVVERGYLGPGTAMYTGAMFPGNGELFVNSVFWLAELDELIAAGARTQDIRRIQAISEGTQAAIWVGLLAGLPLLILVSGVSVWFVRRKV